MLGDLSCGSGARLSPGPDANGRNPWPAVFKGTISAAKTINNADDHGQQLSALIPFKKRNRDDLLERDDID